MKDNCPYQPQSQFWIAYVKVKSKIKINLNLAWDDETKIYIIWNVHEIIYKTWKVFSIYHPQCLQLWCWPIWSMNKLTCLKISATCNYYISSLLVTFRYLRKSKTVCTFCENRIKYFHHGSCRRYVYCCNQPSFKVVQSLKYVQIKQHNLSQRLTCSMWKRIRPLSLGCNRNQSRNRGQ